MLAFLHDGAFAAERGFGVLPVTGFDGASKVLGVPGHEEIGHNLLFSLPEGLRTLEQPAGRISALADAHVLLQFHVVYLHIETFFAVPADCPRFESCVLCSEDDGYFLEVFFGLFLV